jgi:hypothetical protein
MTSSAACGRTSAPPVARAVAEGYAFITRSHGGKAYPRALRIGKPFRVAIDRELEGSTGPIKSVSRFLSPAYEGLSRLRGAVASKLPST